MRNLETNQHAVTLDMQIWCTPHQPALQQDEGECFHGCLYCHTGRRAPGVLSRKLLVLAQQPHARVWRPPIRCQTHMKRNSPCECRREDFINMKPSVNKLRSNVHTVMCTANRCKMLPGMFSQAYTLENVPNSWSSQSLGKPLWFV